MEFFRTPLQRHLCFLFVAMFLLGSLLVPLWTPAEASFASLDVFSYPDGTVARSWGPLLSDFRIHVLLLGVFGVRCVPICSPWIKFRFSIVVQMFFCTAEVQHSIDLWLAPWLAFRPWIESRFSIVLQICCCKRSDSQILHAARSEAMEI